MVSLPKSSQNQTLQVMIEENPGDEKLCLFQDMRSTGEFGVEGVQWFNSVGEMVNDGLLDSS